MPEKATTEPTEITASQPSEDPSEATASQPSKIQYICSVCGKLVLPLEVTTKKGLRHKCPECKKFMKPLNPEEVAQWKAAEAKITPTRLSSEIRYICSVCGKLVVPLEIPSPTGTRHQCPECRKFMKPLNPKEVKQREAKESNNRQKE